MLQKGCHMTGPAANLNYFDIIVTVNDTGGPVYTSQVFAIPALSGGVDSAPLPVYFRRQPVSLRLSCETADVGKTDQKAKTSNFWTLVVLNNDPSSGALFKTSIVVNIAVETTAPVTINHI